MMGTIYVASLSKDDYKSYDWFTTEYRDSLDEMKNVRAAWAVDGALSFADATGAVLAIAGDNAVRDTITVTRIIPRPLDPSERLDAARNQLRADYWNDVHDVISNLKDEIATRNIETETEAADWLDQTVDGHGRVIYTGRAIECLLFTRNDEAYEEYGGLADIGADSTGVMYSRLAYHAFHADISDELPDVAALIEDAAPDLCEDCGEELQDEGNNDDDKCPECRANDAAYDESAASADFNANIGDDDTE